VESSRRLTIRDVAQRAGVSVSTVSKVINRRYGVSADTFANVMGVIEETGYHASLVAQSLRNHRTNVIGVLVADIELFAAELLKGIADGIRESGWELVVYSAAGHATAHPGWERRYLSRLSGTLIDGAILVTPTVVDANYGSPVVAVDPHTGTERLPTVHADNLRGAELAVEHLLDLGHRRIGMITGRPDLQSAKIREKGFRRALRRAGIEVDEALLAPGDYRPDMSKTAASTLLSARPRPTAIFAANDAAAIGVLTAAAEMGLRIPRDLSIVGFDNVPESAATVPPLTTIEQPIHQMGKCAVELLLSLMEGQTPKKTHITLPTRLILRDSTAPPRAPRSRSDR
jgi:LacI family transcriptional regulator